MRNTIVLNTTALMTSAVILCQLAVFPTRGLAAENKPAQPTPTTFQQWINDLSNEQFETRQKATSALIEQGKLSIPYVEQAALKGDLEVAVRAIKILTALYVNTKDKAQIDAVELTLRKLSKSGNRYASSRALDALEQNYVVCQRVAFAEILKRGGKFLNENFSVFDPLSNPSEVEVTTRQGAFSRPVRQPDGGPVPPEQYQLLLGPSWKKGDEGLSAIKRLRRIRQLIYVERSNGITTEGLNSLKSELPDLIVTSRGPALLGISSLARRDGCFVLKVNENSSASEGGILQNDRIVRFNGRDVPHFEALVDMIAELNAGDRVPVVVLRRRNASNYAEIISLTVDLKGWP